MNPQIQALRRGTDIIVACPGRLLDLLSQGYGDLSRVEVAVLDEADHMFDMGFLPDIRRILALLPRQRQSLLFSATMPAAVRHLVDETLRDPVTVAVDRSAPPETVAHALYPVEAHLKTDLLLALLKHWDARRVLVFTRTKHRAKRLAEKLDGRGLFVASLQGNLSQRKRQEALDGFKRGDVHVLVATDIAARGIDVALVSHVVNYDIPDTEEAYVHRIGRTGRARHEGDAVTFVTREDHDMVRRIEKSLGEPSIARSSRASTTAWPRPRASTRTSAASSAAAWPAAVSAAAPVLVPVAGRPLRAAARRAAAPPAVHRVAVRAAAALRAGAPRAAARRGPAVPAAARPAVAPRAVPRGPARVRPRPVPPVPATARGAATARAAATVAAAVAAGTDRGAPHTPAWAPEARPARRPSAHHGGRAERAAAVLGSSRVRRSPRRRSRRPPCGPLAAPASPRTRTAHAGGHR
jgi:ATP-dependent RNA helicase RhlE